MKEPPEINRVGVGWYSENEWYKLRTVAVDADKLEKTYEEWLEAFRKGCDKLSRADITAVKVPVQVQDLVEWCSRKGLPVDAEARSGYIAEQIGGQPAPGQRKETRETVREVLFEAIEKQIRDDNPEETRLTLERLMREGFSRNEAMRMIALALVREWNGMMKTGKPFNQARYVKALKALPKMS